MSESRFDCTCGICRLVSAPVRTVIPADVLHNLARRRRTLAQPRGER